MKEALRIFSKKYKQKKETDTSSRKKHLSTGQEGTVKRIILIHRQNQSTKNVFSKLRSFGFNSQTIYTKYEKAV